MYFREDTLKTLGLFHMVPQTDCTPLFWKMWARIYWFLEWSSNYLGVQQSFCFYHWGRIRLYSHFFSGKLKSLSLIGLVLRKQDMPLRHFFVLSQQKCDLFYFYTTDIKAPPNIQGPERVIKFVSLNWWWEAYQGTVSKQMYADIQKVSPRHNSNRTHWWV